MPPKEKPVPPPHVLVVDDEAHIRRLIEVNLRAAGLEVTTAADGAEAARHLDQLTPDLIILDLLMPRLSGWDVLRAIRSHEATLTTPVLVLSALPPMDPRNAVCHELADAYWQKPFSPLRLLAWVDQRLGRLTPQQRADVAAWRQLRFGDGLTPEVAAEHMEGHYLTVRMEAEAVLRQMGAEATPALIGLAEGASAAWRPALFLLGQRPEPEAAEALGELLAHADRERRWEAYAALAGSPTDHALLLLADRGGEVLDELLAALGSTEEALSRQAAIVLRRVRTPEALRALRDAGHGLTWA